MKYAGMVGTLDTSKQGMFLESNPMHEQESLTKGESPSKAIENVTRRKEGKRRAEVGSWLAQKTVRVRSRVMSLSDRQHVNIHGKTKGNTGTRLVVDNMCHDTLIHYSDLFWNDPNYFEHAVLSVCTTNQKFFQESAKLSKENDKKLDTACQFVHGALLESCQQFGDKQGSVDKSFVAIVCEFQTNIEKMKMFVEKLPVTLKDMGSSKPNICHRLLVDYVACQFQIEFVRTVDELKKAKSENMDTVSKDLNAILIEHQSNAETRNVKTASVSEEEAIAEVHKFVGHAVSQSHATQSL